MQGAKRHPMFQGQGPCLWLYEVQGYIGKGRHHTSSSGVPRHWPSVNQEGSAGTSHWTSDAARLNHNRI